MTERSALLLAGSAHLALLAALSLSWALTHRQVASVEAVPVEILAIGDVPTITATPKASIKAAPREASYVPAAGPEAPQPATVEPAEPSRPPPLPEAPQVAVASPQPKPAAAKRSSAEPRRLDAGELNSLIDKSLPKAPRKPLDTSDFASSIEKALPKGVKIDARAVATLEQAIRAQISPCWNPPLGAEGLGKLTVVLRIALKRDGNIAGPPELVSASGGEANPAYARAFAESAKRAVVRCAPLDLPADMYEAWRAFELNFDPTQMG